MAEVEEVNGKGGDEELEIGRYRATRKTGDPSATSRTDRYNKPEAEREISIPLVVESVSTAAVSLQVCIFRPVCLLVENIQRKCPVLPRSIV